MKNYYHIMEIPYFAEAGEIKSAFKKLALRWHPDKHSAGRRNLAHHKFIEILEAYEILGNPEQRREYDASLHVVAPRPQNTGNPRPSYARSAPGSGLAQGIKNSVLKISNLIIFKPYQTAQKLALKVAKLFLAMGLSVIRSTKKILIKISASVLTASEKKQHQKAIRRYRKVLRQRPNDSNLHHKLAFSLYCIGKLDEAADHYLKAIKLSPDDANIFCNIGRLREAQKKFGRAVLCYEKALEIEPVRAPVYFNLGMLYIIRGDYQLAGGCIDKLIDFGLYGLAGKIKDALPN